MSSLTVNNPWTIQSLYDLQYFNCPACFFKDNSKQTFVNHAYELHPEAIGSLKNIQDESMRDVTHPWTLKEEVKNENNFDDVDPFDQEDDYMNFETEEFNNDDKKNIINNEISKTIPNPTVVLAKLKPMVCVVCDKYYVKKEDLQSHWKKFHEKGFFDKILNLLSS